jgi:hypothetical protein
MVNPVTGEQAALPAISTMPFIDDADPWFSLAIKSSRDCGGQPYDDDLTSFNINVLEALDNAELPKYFTAHEIRFSFYSKVVLSATPRPGSYCAMLILDRQFGGAAFATAQQDPIWVHGYGSGSASLRCRSWTRRPGGGRRFMTSGMLRCS